MECPQHGALVMCFSCRCSFCYDCLPAHSHGADVRCYICADRGCRKCIEKRIEELKASGQW